MQVFIYSAKYREFSTEKTELRLDGTFSSRRTPFLEELPPTASLPGDAEQQLHALSFAAAALAYCLSWMICWRPGLELTSVDTGAAAAAAAAAAARLKNRRW